MVKFLAVTALVTLGAQCPGRGPSDLAGNVSTGDGQEWTDLPVFSTGVGMDSRVLADEQVDPHYTLIVSPDPAFPGPSTTTQHDETSPMLNGYVPDNERSRWIGPRPDGGDNFPHRNCGELHPLVVCESAVYEYQTTFDLTGLDPATTRIAGRWACDDAGEILLNGLPTGISRAQATGDESAFRSWSEFTISSGFTTGINTLIFRVRNGHFPDSNGPNATGLRVEIASAKAVRDLCPDDPLKTAAGDCGCGLPDADTDGDGVSGCIDGQ